MSEKKKEKDISTTKTLANAFTIEKKKPKPSK